MKYTIPNQLTLIRIFLTPVFYFLIITNDPYYRFIATIVYFLASFTDWYDGFVARRYHMTSRWGQFMDPLADKLLVSTALFVFARMHYIFWWMVITVLVRDFIVTGLRIFALYIGKPIITSLFAKWKTFIQMAFTFLLLIYINVPRLPPLELNRVSQPWYLWTTITMALVTLLTVISGLQYLIVNWSHASELARRFALLLRRK